MKKFLDSLAKFIASFFGIGFLPFAPGTFGSIVGVVIYYVLERHEFIFYAVLFFLIMVGFAICGKAEIAFRKKDSRYIIIDEVVGTMLAFILVPLNILNVLVVFVLFRLLDVFKPYPIRSLEKATGGFGVMLDDIAAGLFTNLLFQVVFNFVSCWTL